MAVQLNSQQEVFLFDNVGFSRRLSVKQLLMPLNPVFVILEKHSKIITRCCDLALPFRLLCTFVLMFL